MLLSIASPGNGVERAGDRRDPARYGPRSRVRENDPGELRSVAACRPAPIVAPAFASSRGLSIQIALLYRFFVITVQASGLVILTTKGRKDLSFIETLALRHRLRRGARCTSNRSFVATLLRMTCILHSNSREQVSLAEAPMRLIKYASACFHR